MQFQKAMLREVNCFSEGFWARVGRVSAATGPGEGVAKINFSPKSFFLKSEVDIYGFLGGLGTPFSGFPVS